MEEKDVYVLDDGSKDRTAREAEATGCWVLSEKNIGKEACIQRGIQRFGLFDRYDYITILDADSTLDTEYVRAIGRCITKYPKVAAISGAVRSQHGKWLTAYRAVETYLSTNVYREAQHFMGNITVAPGCSTTYNTAKFRCLDFTGGTLVEDMDWTVQFHRRGDQVVQAMDAIVYTQDPATLKGLYGQVQRWHRGTWQVVRLHKLCRRWTKIDAEFVIILGEALIYGMLLFLLPLWYWLNPVKTMWAVVADQSILLFFVLLTAWRDKRWDVLYLWPLFIIPRLMCYFSFVWAFIRERRPQKVVWYSPERW